MASSITNELAVNGIALLPDLLNGDQLRAMKVGFEARLRRMRWNNSDGYEKTERYRHMVEDVLLLDQGFVDAALNPAVTIALREYIGGSFELVEAKGWKSLPTTRDFHGWHGDAWYDQNLVRDRIPREVKLGIFLTDVNSGGFVYVKGTHGTHHPRSLIQAELNGFLPDQIAHVNGPAGSAFLFDTSGFHRQSVPILQPREAVFYAYHDPSVPLQREDIEYNRYHPLLLNAAFLGQLSDEDRRILGFGNRINFRPGHQRAQQHTRFQKAIRQCHDAIVLWDEFRERVQGKLKRHKRSEKRS
jgi:hypothetical protein